MPKKKQTPHAEGFTIDADSYTHMLSVMDELAFRGPIEESTVMRIAKAGNIKDAMKPITRRRIYAKTHRKEAQQPGDGATKPKRGGPKRRRSDRAVTTPKQPEAAGAGDGHQADAGAA